MKTFWVGLETTDHPNGHGEDHREYVTVAQHEDGDEKLHQAVLRIAQAITVWDDGSRIAVRLYD